MSLMVVEPGLATTVQDTGRPGLAHLGVPRGGAVDLDLAAALNRLVGNPSDAALLETVGGLRVRAQRSMVVATDHESAVTHLQAGAEMTIAAGGGRQWHYLAVEGGIATPVVLGSRSHDTLSGIGMTSLVAGGELPVARSATAPPPIDVAPFAMPDGVVRVTSGPRLDWFEHDAVAALTTAEWRIVESSRVGVRLRGTRIARRVARELPSEGLVRGAIQMPPDGDPVMMLADHPTTGGYPVIAVVVADDVARLAQRPAGAVVKLRMTSSPLPARPISAE